MRSLALLLALAVSLVSAPAFGASYQDKFGPVVGPIQYRPDLPAIGSGDHPYSGPDLFPAVQAPGAVLFSAFLENVDMIGGNLQAADFQQAYMFRADLDSANLTSVDFRGAVLDEADFLGAVIAGASFEGASLVQAVYLDTAYVASVGIAPTYDANTDFTGTGFDPVAAGWTLVPEPGTALLMGLGLAGLAARRR